MTVAEAKAAGRLRLLMTLDAVGGVWRYAMDLAAALKPRGFDTVFAGFGPPPSSAQRAEAHGLGMMTWQDQPLDWMVRDEKALADIPPQLARLAGREGIDLIHLNLPSQAAGLAETGIPVVTVCHSCVPGWFAAVKASAPPDDWRWHLDLNRRGMERADAVVTPSQSHADHLRAVYGDLPEILVVHNGRHPGLGVHRKQRRVMAVGRWWDEGKNGAVIDAAAALLLWPMAMIGPLEGPDASAFVPRHAMAKGEKTAVQVADDVRAAAIFVSASRYEPFGLSVLEAAGSGAALVLSDIATHRELWQGAALYFDRRDAQALATTVNRLIAEPLLRAELGVKARARASRFTAGRQAEAMERLYRRLMEAKGQKAGEASGDAVLSPHMAGVG
ncbi:glycosyltransferase family 4 protein [Allorhizobium sp. BGMRC 0089]|uniref:glycosyltransferase family 4 protein n=1 Tax=Allorhizobium sonneratiae TaxID=2934936 RepID=UPI002033F2D9|nr:glycosyltransferase family 4 protein [Allorhizobium sonneratiae]MCM2293985.1 glycosyltransferase family 4 protein [Allorhizobium sonneratiae]